MPPKDAKGKGGKGAPTAAKVVDAAEYVRPVTAAVETKESMSLEAEKCKIKNTETLFPEWGGGIESEPWGEAHAEGSCTIVQPAYLPVTAKSVSIKSFFALDVEAAPVDPKAKGAPAKKDAKKGGAPASIEIRDDDANEAGVQLPKIYIDTESNTFEGFAFSHPFATIGSDNSKRVDEIMCNAFEFVSQYAKNMPSPPTTGMEFLWRSIYPKNAQGKPCFSPAGKYFVRLFIAGKWRKIPVDDQLPLSEDGMITLAASSNKYELWPTIISKAVYLVLNKCGYNINKAEMSCKESSSILGFIVHLLTGWTPTSPLQVSQLWESSLSELGTLLQEMVHYKVAQFETAHIPESLDTLVAAIPSNTISVDEKVIMKTKKQLKEDFQKQKVERDAMEKRILTRESKILDMTNNLAVPVFEASFISFLDNDNKLNVLQILGIHYPDPSVENVALLVKFKVNEKVDVNKSEEAANAPSWKIQLPSLPNCSVLDSSWVSLKDIIQFNPILISMDTHLVQNQMTHLGWHWKAAAPPVEDAKAAGGKDKGKKGGAPEPAKDASTDPVEDPGLMPPVLLSIDTKALEGIEGVTNIPLSIFIHADTFDDGSVEGFCNFKDNVVLLAQELGSSNEEGPVVMRVELSSKSILPVTRVTFNIPTNRIPTEGKPFLFLIRLFTSSSVFITFHSAVPVNVGPADDIWKGAGLNAYTFSGDSVMTRPGSENVLFRLPIGLDPSSAVSAVTSSAESSDSSSTTEKMDTSETVLVYVHVASRKVGDLISLLNIPRAGQSGLTSNPIGSSAIIKLRSEDLTLLVGAINSYSISQNIPSFPWKITILSNTKLNNPTLCNCVAGTQTYAGSYIGNNKLCLFNEIYAVDKASFPMALRVNIESLSNFFTQENIWIKLLIKRKSDKKVICEYSSRGILPIYMVDSADITGEETPAAASSAAPADPKAKKDDKKGAKGGAVTTETIDLIFECLLDETKMLIPLEWRTRYPHYFDLKLAPCVANNAPVIKWSVNILCGAVVTVQHEISELEKQAAQKNVWEEKSEGRAERALAAMNAYQLKKALYQKESSVDADVDALADAVSASLNAENKDLMKEKQRSIFATTSEFKEIINPLKELDSKVVLDEASIQRYKETFTEVMTKREETLDSYRKSLVALNESSRTLTKLRSDAILANCVANSNELAAIWQERESYRNHTIKYNAALQYLVSKGNEIVQAEQDKEDEANGIKKDKKGGKKK